MIYVERVYRELRPSDRSLGRAVRLVDFVLVHEIGHALVDAYDVPVGGKEEDAVDALATVMTTRFVEGGSEIAVAGADFFGALADKRGTSFSESDFWAEHSLDRPRADTIASWAADRQKVTGWLRKLKPHLKG